jgi:integrase
MKERLTEARIASCKPQASRRVELQDEACPGLWLRVTPDGTKSFAVRYWVRGDKQGARITLGRHPTLSLKTARLEAAKILDVARQGIDSRYQPVARDDLLTFDEAGIKFFQWRARQRGTRRFKDGHLEESARRFRVEFSPILGHRPVTKITRTELRTLLQNIENRAPTVARHAFHDLSVFFKWLAEEDILDSGALPIVGLRKPSKPDSRERVLSRRELASIWQATREQTSFNVIVRLLILTAQRRSEVTCAEWSEFDFEDATWTIPGPDTKNSRTQCVPLSSLAIDVLGAWRRVYDLQPLERVKYKRNLFPSAGQGPNSYCFVGFSRCKRRLDDRANVHKWRLHDIRRTVSTSLAELRVEPHVIDAVLNHKSGTIKGVAAVYNRYPYLAEMREALEMWAGVVRGFDKTT